MLAHAYTPWNGSLCLKPSLCSQGPSRPATGRQQTRAKGNLGQDPALQGFTEQVESRDKHQQRTTLKCPCCEQTPVALQCLFLLCIILSHTWEASSNRDVFRKRSENTHLGFLAQSALSEHPATPIQVFCSVIRRKSSHLWPGESQHPLGDG